MSTISKRLRIATRESRLALRQTTLVADAIRARHPSIEIGIVAMTRAATACRPAAGTGGRQGLFVKERRQRSGNRADIACIR